MLKQKWRNKAVQIGCYKQEVDCFDTKTFPGGTVIGNDSVQRMTMVWMWSMENNTRTKEIKASQAF